jgi:hypothetical protein
VKVQTLLFLHGQLFVKEVHQECFTSPYTPPEVQAPDQGQVAFSPYKAGEKARLFFIRRGTNFVKESLQESQRDLLGFIRLIFASAYSFQVTLQRA